MKATIKHCAELAACLLFAGLTLNGTAALGVDACTAAQKDRLAEVCVDLTAAARARHTHYSAVPSVATSRSDAGQDSVNSMTAQQNLVSSLQAELLELFAACQTRKCPAAK